MALNDRFRAGIAKSIKKAEAKTEDYFKKLIVDLSSSIINKTPVDKGQLHWNWFIGNGNINGETVAHAGEDKAGAGLRNALHVNGLNIHGQTIFITNSLPYAYRIEHEGWSRKAPAGMVRVTLAELNSISTKAAYEIKNR